MTECCLFVCCRPYTAQRLVDSLYPKDTTGYEEILKPIKLKRLIDYSISYPKKLIQICKILEIRIKKDFILQKRGYVLIGFETFRGLSKECLHTDLIETIDTYLTKSLLMILTSHQILFLEIAFPTFVDFTNTSNTINIQKFLSPILQLIDPKTFTD